MTLQPGFDLAEIPDHTGCGEVEPLRKFTALFHAGEGRGDSWPCRMSYCDEQIGGADD